MTGLSRVGRFHRGRAGTARRVLAAVTVGERCGGESRNAFHRNGARVSGPAFQPRVRAVRDVRRYPITTAATGAHPVRRDARSRRRGRARRGVPHRGIRRRSDVHRRSTNYGGLRRSTRCGRCDRVDATRRRPYAWDRSVRRRGANPLLASRCRRRDSEATAVVPGRDRGRPTQWNAVRQTSARVRGRSRFPSSLDVPRVSSLHRYRRPVDPACAHVANVTTRPGPTRAEPSHGHGTCRTHSGWPASRDCDPGTQRGQPGPQCSPVPASVSPTREADRGAQSAREGPASHGRGRGAG